MRNPKFCIKTFGCKVNQYESQMIREDFLKNGYVEADDINKADIYIINTCTVTSGSDSKSLKAIRAGMRGKGRRVIATGCMIEAGDLDAHKLKGADFIIKNKDKYRIVEIISEKHSPRPDIITGFKGHARAFVKVQDGCNNICSYCKVRIVRGKSRSRPLRHIMDEAAALIKNGYREIVLTGICLGAYGRDARKTGGISNLIRELAKIEGDWRMRLSSIEPKDVTEELIELITSEEKLCKHLHVPFQSGDDEILKKMDRPYTASGYGSIVARLRMAVPDIAVSTDIMVGFPGEKESNFRNTLEFIREIQPMRLHVFGFSRRPGTPAYDYKDTVDSALKKKREHILMDAVKEFSLEFEKMFIGKEAKVLVEDKRDKQGFLQGYTDRYIKVLIDGPDSMKSSLINCRLTQTSSALLVGIPV
ncbi:MAG: tRNA (N(6)-L-threonylcarbamoyladenosine(37)-C(2))-methylthiotransferase MtaB [Candidatus Omnitrophota bacterium]|jgi:threonylcarbamoyladenosine tRNA methylthiotransferase MtaB